MADAKERVVVGEGDTVRKAFEQARGQLARELDTTFLETTIIGERAAAIDVSDLDWIFRSQRIPVTGFVGVAKGTAESMLRAKTPGYALPGIFMLQGMSGVYTRSPAVARTYLWGMFNRDYFVPLQDMAAPAITNEIYGINWDGLAVFHQKRLAGYLTPEETAAFSMLQNRKFEYTIGGDLKGDSAGFVSLHAQQGKIRRWVTGSGSNLVLHVDARVHGDLRELVGMRLKRPADERFVEIELARILADDIATLLRTLQRLESDPLGFGELAREAAPYAPDVQSEDAWYAAYRNARLEVTARVTITSTGYVD